MGVAGLWERLDSAGDKVSVHQLGWQTHPTLGIDASIWLIQTLAICQPTYPNQHLLILFHKLSALLRVPLNVVFVFDGPGRAGLSKRGKVVRGGELEGERQFRELVKAFGFGVWPAPGEAEAELGQLNRLGKVDFVVSEDVDALLFDSRRVLLRTKMEDTKGDQLAFQMFDAQKIEQELGVDRKGLILVGLMSGGDYDQTGVVRCGPSISFVLAQQGFGTSLIQAYESLPRQTFIADFLPSFRADVAEMLRTNPDGVMGKKYVKLAKEVLEAETFPDLEVLERYLRPLVSSLDELEDFPGTFEGVDIGRLTKLLRGWLEWSQEGCLKKFRATLWEGLVCRSILNSVGEQRRKKASSGGGGKVTGHFNMIGHSSAASNRSSVKSSSTLQGSSQAPTSRTTTPSADLVKGITRWRKHPSTGNVLEYRIEIDPISFVDAVLAVHVAPSSVRLVPSSSSTSTTIRKSTDRSSSSDENVDDDDDLSRPSSGSQKSSKDPPKPTDPVLFWFPHKHLKRAHPALVAEYERRELEKVERKAEKVKRAEERAAGKTAGKAGGQAKEKQKKVKGKGKGKERLLYSSEEEGEEEVVQGNARTLSIGGKTTSSAREEVFSRPAAPTSSQASIPSSDVPRLVGRPPDPPRPSKPKSTKPTYVSVSSSESDVAPPAPSSRPPARTTSPARPSRREPVTESPSSSSSSANPSPKKSPRKSRTAAARRAPVEFSDEDDAELFPANPFKTLIDDRRTALSSTTSVVMGRSSPGTSTSSTDRLAGRAPSSSRASPTKLSSPLKHLSVSAQSTSSVVVVVGEGEEEEAEVIDLCFSSPVPSSSANPLVRRNSKAGPKKAGGEVFGLERKTSNPWTKSRRAGSGGAKGGKEKVEVIELSD